MKKKAKLRIGVIGVGYMGQYHVNILSEMLTHKLVGIFDTNQDRGRQLAGKYETRSFNNVENLLERVEAVVIAVPTENHYQYAKLALEYNCHVLVEKPITPTVIQAKQLMDLAAKKDMLLQVGHVERFNGAVIELHKIVTDPLLIEARRLSPFVPRIKDVGVVLDMLIHDLDIILNLVKSPVVSYYGLGRAIESQHEDVAIINLVFQNNCLATLTASRVSQKKERSMTITQNQNLIFLNYSNQDIEIYRQSSTAYLMTREEVKYSQESFVEKLFVQKDNPLKSQHRHFYECIVEGKTPLVTNGKDIETLSIALSVIEQIERQKMEEPIHQHRIEIEG